MRARRKRNATDADMVKILDSVIADLDRMECLFWACEGPDRPRHMVTCAKCWTQRSIGTVRETLAAREVQP